MALGAPTYLMTPGSLGNNLGLDFMAALVVQPPSQGGFGSAPFGSAPFGA
jgi:hypothetical protein